MHSHINFDEGADCFLLGGLVSDRYVMNPIERNL